MKQPNFLFIMADQMAAQALPIYGHPLVQTPHLSRLAENGIVLDNAYCNSPLCAPSRFSMLTGQLPSRIRRASVHMTMRLTFRRKYPLLHIICGTLDIILVFAARCTWWGRINYTDLKKD
jgi:arylsulfatase A-like enzyme